MKYPPANVHNPIHCRALTVMSRESSVISPPRSSVRYRRRCLSWSSQCRHHIKVEASPQLSHY